MALWQNRPWRLSQRHGHRAGPTWPTLEQARASNCRLARTALALECPAAVPPSDRIQKASQPQPGASAAGADLVGALASGPFRFADRLANPLSLPRQRHGRPASAACFRSSSTTFWPGTAFPDCFSSKAELPVGTAPRRQARCQRDQALLAWLKWRRKPAAGRQGPATSGWPRGACKPPAGGLPRGAFAEGGLVQGDQRLPQGQPNGSRPGEWVQLASVVGWLRLALRPVLVLPAR